MDGAGRLRAGGVDVAGVAREYGTPLHLVDVGRLREVHDAFLAPFAEAGARVRLATSYKTNPVPFVLEKLHEWGTLAEVISPFELSLALKLEVPGDRIIFNGPGKTRESLELAVREGVWLINADSGEELRAVQDIAAQQGRRQKIGLRVTTEVGWRSQFGLPVRGGAAFEGFRMAAEASHLEPVALHLHLGTGVTAVHPYVQAAGEVLELGRRVRAELGLPLSVIDLGGGFPVPTTRTMDTWDRRMQHLGMPPRTAEPGTVPTAESFARALVPMMNSYVDDMGLKNAEFIFEPGRAITGPAQMLLLSVLRVKWAGRTVPDLILDGGRNLCMPLAWEFHEIHPVARMLDDVLEAQNLYGPLCHPHDIVALNKSLPPLEEGDVVAVMDAGAYFVPNQTNFSNPRPGVVAVADGRVKWVRRPETFSDMLRLDTELDQPWPGGS